MKLLSIDIGIKNLGLCLFDVNNKEFQIVEWNIYNLLNIHKCNENNCTKPIKYYKNNKYYCKSHAKKIENILIPSECIQNIHKHKNENLSFFFDYCSEHNIPYNLPIIKKDLFQVILKFIDDNYFDIYTEENCKNIDLIKLGVNLNFHLNELLKHHTNIECIIIENQISPIANRMKTLQGMVAQYFIIKNITNIKFVSSYNKLKLFNNKKISYREKKKLSIEITSKFLNQTNNLDNWKQVFFESKKKDDLADCFLQGYYFLINGQYINNLF